MAAADNPYYISPANPLQALMGFDASYKDARTQRLQDLQQAGRQEAAQALQSGGDPRPALAKLLGVGDVQGANAIATFAHQQATQQQAQQQLAESSRHNTATEGLTGQSLAQTALQQGREFGLQTRKQDFEENKPVTLPFGSSLVTRKGETIKQGEQALLDPETIGLMADQYMAGDTSVLQNLGRGAQGAENIVALRKEVAARSAAKGEGGAERAQANAEFQGSKSAQRALGTRTANIEMAAAEAQRVFPVLLDASKAVDRTQYPSINSILLAWREGSGDQNVVRLGAAANAAINVYSRAIAPTGQPTVSDKEHAREILNKAWSQGQIGAVVDLFQKEIAAARASPGDVKRSMREQNTGRESAAPASPAAATQGPVKVGTPADAAKLAPGTHYVTPDGREFTR